MRMRIPKRACLRMHVVYSEVYSIPSGGCEAKPGRAGPNMSLSEPVDFHMDEIQEGRVSYRSERQFSRSFAELNSLRGCEKLCDVVLVAGEERLPAHRVILASISAYFCAMFTGEMAESRKKEIVINGIEPSVLKILVDYAYTACVELTEGNIQSLLIAASALQFDEVKEAASQFLLRQLDADNCLGIRRFAELHGCELLHSAAEVYSTHWFTDVHKHEEFLGLSLQEVCNFLSSDRLNVGTEYEVFEAALLWLSHDEDERMGYIYNIMSHVRFPLFTKEQLLKGVGHNPAIIGNAKCVELMVEALQCHLLPETKEQVDPFRLVPRKPSEKLYAIGGWDGHTAVSIVEYYDTESDEWKLGKPLHTRRNGVGLAFANGLLYAIGGHDGQAFLNTAEVFDPRTNQWQAIPPLQYRRASTGIAVHGNYIYAIGGQDGTMRLKSVERFNVLTKSWEVVASMNMRRDSPGVVVHEDEIFAIGGCHSCMFLDTVEKYQPTQNCWLSSKNMLNRRSAVGAVSLDGHIYVFGGHNEQCNLSVMERYDPREDSWTQLASMNSPRAGVGATILNRKIVAVGGFDGSDQLNTVEQYDPATDTWSYLPAMTHERSYVGAVATVKMI